MIIPARRTHPILTILRITVQSIILLFAGLLALWAILAQLLAIIPSQWLVPALRFGGAQTVILTISIIRDGMGVYGVIYTFVPLVLLLLLLWWFRRKPRWLKVLVTLCAAAFVVSLITYISLVVTVAREGGGVHAFAPATMQMQQWGKPDQTLTFGEPDGTPLKADLYLPSQTSASATSEGKVPVVVRVHGGGFTAGDKAPTPYNRFLADHGYAVLDVQYRLANPQQHTWQTEVGDVGCALTWLNTKGADNYPLDLSRVGIFGDSAGGNLAINAAYMSNNGTLQPTCGNASDLPHIKAVTALYPVVNMVVAQQQSAIGYTVGQSYIGGTPAQYPERYEFTAPMTHVSKQAPPTLIIQGGRDHLVLPGPVQEFATQIAAKGIVTRYIELPFLDHQAGDGLSTITVGTLAQQQFLLNWMDQYVK